MLENAKQLFEKYLEIEKERNLQMLEVSRLLGVDFTFSEEELLKNAEEQLAKHMEKQLTEKVEKMFKGMK